MSTALAAAAPGHGVRIDAASPTHPSVLHYGCAVLGTGDHLEKARLTAEAAHWYKLGALPLMLTPEAAAAAAAAAAASSSSSSSSSTATASSAASSSSSPVSASVSAATPVSDASWIFPVPPTKPARPAHLTVVAPKDVPGARKGVENHAYNKMRLIHSLAHIESYAIDLSWDVCVRFASPLGGAGLESTNGVAMPAEFFEDWMRIAAEEAKHFLIWNTRLEELESRYGALPIHEGLWQSAGETSHSLLARLAVVHCVHEARGLDQAPKMLQQLQGYGDKQSMHLLEVIERDELTHVSSGLRWFKYICERAPSGPIDPIPEFHRIVRDNFRGSLLPPFNTAARSACGFTEEWYLPLAVKKPRPAAAAAAEGAAAAAPAAAASQEEKEGPLPEVEQIVNDLVASTSAEAKA